MNFQEIRGKYRDEWVLIEYGELDETLQIKEGRVISHSRNREDVYKALSQTLGKNVSVEYLGSPQSDLTVMFLLK